MLRKILTIIIFSIFVICSVPFFLGLSFSHTFFSGTFYTGTLLNTAYTPVVNVITKNMIGLDPAFGKYFTEDEVKQLLTTHFTKDVVRQAISITAAAFNQDIDSVSSETPPSEKLNIKIDFSPFVEPSSLFLKELTQKTLDRLPPCASGVQPKMVGVFPDCSLASWQTDNFKAKFNEEFQKDYKQNVLKSMVAPGETGYVSNVALDVSRSDIARSLHQFEMIDAYVLFFVLAFVSLMLLLWFRNLATGLSLSGMMLISSSVLGLILAFVLSRLVSFLPSDMLTDSSVSKENFILARDVLNVILVSYAKVYAVILGIVMCLGGVVYFYARRYLKRS